MVRAGGGYTLRRLVIQAAALSVLGGVRRTRVDGVRRRRAINEGGGGGGTEGGERSKTSGPCWGRGAGLGVLGFVGRWGGGGVVWGVGHGGSVLGGVVLYYSG